ncbi:MAG: hypothetical protein WCT07_02890 [Candidatus Paceibacterota bacterium]
MKNFKKSLLGGLVILAISSAAFASGDHHPSTNYSAVADGSGRVSIQSSTYASVVGAGDSMSSASASAGAASTGTASAGYDGIDISGSLSGYVNAQAYNVSTGKGTGSASAGGWSDAGFMGIATSSVPDMGYVSGVVGIDGGMGNAVLNGVDAHVSAKTNQNGYAGGTYAGEGSLSGSPAEVDGTQSAYGEAYAGNITFTDGTPVPQTAAARSANSGVQVDVHGSFDNVDMTHGEFED